MKKLVLSFALLFGVALFTGCAETSSSDVAYTPPDEEIAAVEGSLLLDRVLAASVLEADASIVASVAGISASKQYRKRTYQTGTAGAGMTLRRGDGTCNAVITADGILVGTEQCVVEKLASGAIKITRANGTILEIPALDATGDPTSLIVDGVEWQVTYGAEVGEPLVTLKNLRSGMLLTVNESDTGVLTIVRDSSEVYSGRWSESGDLEIADGSGKQHRYRYGRNQ